MKRNYMQYNLNRIKEHEEKDNFAFYNKKELAPVRELEKNRLNDYNYQDRQIRMEQERAYKEMLDAQIRYRPNPRRTPFQKARNDELPLDIRFLLTSRKSNQIFAWQFAYASQSNHQPC